MPSRMLLASVMFFLLPRNQYLLEDNGAAHGRRSCATLPPPHPCLPGRPGARILWDA